MGHAARAVETAPSQRTSGIADRDTVPAGMVEVELDLETDLDELEPEDEETPWVVDYGNAMEVMTTEALRRALAAGRVAGHTKVWRDGHACWQPAADFSELERPRPWRRRLHRSSDDDRITIPEQSGLRRIPGLREGRADRGIEPRTRTRAFTSAFFLGLVLGAVTYLPFAWQDTFEPVPVKAQKVLTAIGR